MMSKKEEEKNEKIIRALRKLPHNRTCMNCNNLGPQYVCTTFWTFVCTTCSGIHREFTHRVKSVSMAKFTAQEVHALQNGGNQRAREIFLKDWDTERMKFPESSNADKIREFINNVYVQKKYARERSSEKPLRDMETTHYESIHEDSRIGKSPIISITTWSYSNSDLSERTCSSSIYSPQCRIDYTHDEKFVKGTTSLFSPEFEVSRTESFRSASESFRSASDSFTSARESFRSACLDTEMDAMVTECENSTIPVLSQSSNSMHVENQYFDNEPFMQPTTAPLTFSVDLFEHRTSYTTSSKNEEWATFDIHEPVGVFSQTNTVAVSTFPSGNEAPKTISSTSMHKSQWCSFQGSLSSEPFTSSDQFHIRVQPFHSFDGSIRNMPNTFLGSQQQDNHLHVPVHTPLACSELNIRLQRLEAEIIHAPKSRNPFDLPYDLDSKGSNEADVVHAPKSTNPFDLPYDFDSKASNESFCASSSQVIMPSLDVPNFFDMQSQQWLPQCSIPQGGMTYMESHTPSSMLLNPFSEGYSASRPGNPFV